MDLSEIWFPLGQQLPQPNVTSFCPMDSRLDFEGKSKGTLQAVFWVTAPVFFLNTAFLIYMIIRSCTKSNKKQSTLTKCQFALLYGTVVLTLIQVGVYTFA